MIKKLVAVFIVGLSFVLVACSPTEFTVTFDSTGGTAVDSVVVEEGNTVAEPTDPTREADGEESAWNFTGWYTDEAATSMYDFSTPVEADLTLYAGWTQQIVVRFNTKTDATVESQYLSTSGGTVTEPAAPTREGYSFGGWYFGKPGPTWNEQEAVEFPLEVTEATQLYAFWAPDDPAEVDYTDGETYKNSFTELDSDPILNPLTYHWSHESTLMDYLSTPLYGYDVDWDQAIEDGLVSEPGDFSNIDDSNIGALLRKNVKYGAAEFPIAVGGEFDGEDGTDQNGEFSEAISREISATTYRYTLRDDIYWEDGTNVTAHDYYYSYFAYIDPVQNNFRASSYYPNAGRSSGMRVVNARNYFLQGTEIGLGESSSNPLGGDYGVAEVSIYAGPNGPAEGTPLSGLNSTLPSSIYITSDQLTEYSLTIGDEAVTYPLGLLPEEHQWVEDYAEAYDFRIDVAENPYYAGDVGDYWPAFDKEDVGFKVIDDYTFEMTFEVPQSHASAMSLGDFTLVNPTVYEASLDENGTNSTYGTSATLPVSYGPYVIKSWDNNQKIIFNKNYDTFMHLYFNYKSISFEFYPNVDSRMQAFEDGLLSSTGLNQTYYSQFLENPNRKSYYNGYPQYLLFNTVEYEGQDSAVAEIIQDQSFRQAFFYGFNRVEYANTIFAPNVPTLLVYSTNATQYDNDEAWYVNTPEYAAMLEDLGIDEDTYGYDPVKAKALFDQAYAAWVADGNTGPVVLNYLTSTGDEQARLDDYIIGAYETLFGNDKIDFVKSINSSEVASQLQDSHEFDITLTGVGTGTVTNLSVMLPILGLFFRETYGDQFGFNTYEELGIPADAFVVDEDTKIDLRNTYAYLQSVSDRWDETTDAGTLQAFYDILDANDGYYVGDISKELFEFGLECTFIWAGLAPQYDGDVADRNAVTRAFDRVILEYATLIPTAGRASSIVYADNVVCDWPAYHNIMEWGSVRYWHLSTDADFQ